MKKIFHLLCLMIITLNIQYGYGQYVADTRDLNEPPADFQRIVRYDFKDKGIIGLSGNGRYSGTMTFAPWSDASGGENYQLNFNTDGIFFRQGLSGNAWGNWRNLVIANSNGVIAADGGSGALQLKPNNKDHAYMEIYARTNSPLLRSAWFGYGEAGSIDLVAKNEISNGNISLITSNGNVGIDTYTPNEKLSVNGKIRAHEIKVETTNWPDFVFAPKYPLMPLQELENYISINRHLPEIPAADKVIQDGFALGEMNKKLLQKVEELSLYIIQQAKINDLQSENISLLQDEIKKIRLQK